MVPCRTRNRVCCQAWFPSFFLVIAALALSTRTSFAEPPPIAAQTRQLLSQLMETDSGELLRVALPAGFRKGFPAAVQAALKEQIEIEGVRLESELRLLSGRG